MLHPQDSKDQRICARRDQIIAASRLCFRKHGFHGAGMAEIAKISQLSVGQIYRYFTNKDAIIEEIVRRIVSKKIRRITSHAHNLQQMAENLAHRRIGDFHLPQSETPYPEINLEQAEIDHALLLEVAAEATRNPVVEKIWRDSENQLFNEACSVLGKTYFHLTQTELRDRVELLAVIIEGTAFRYLATLHADPQQLNLLYDHLFRQLFQPSLVPPQ